jgi:hypothetical protein
MPLFGSRFQRGGEPSSTFFSAKMSSRPCTTRSAAAI